VYNPSMKFLPIVAIVLIILLAAVLFVPVRLPVFNFYSLNQKILKIDKEPEKIEIPDYSDTINELRSAQIDLQESIDDIRARARLFKAKLYMIEDY